MSDAHLLALHALGVEVAGISVAAGLTLQLAPGDCLAVLGRNGVGKSSLLATLAGLRGCQKGEVLYLGEPASAWTARELACFRAWLPQQQEDAFAATVLDTVLVGRHPWLSRFERERSEDVGRAVQLLEKAGLQGFEHRNVQTLSGGERQRVALVALRLQDARLWLLDEPLNHLDVTWQLGALDCIAGHAALGNAAVMVLHDVNLALRYCNRFLLLLGQGRWRLLDRAGLDEVSAVSELWGQPARRIGDAQGSWFVPA